MSTGSVDPRITYTWAHAFFTENPKASIHTCLKAMNNERPRIPPLHSVVKSARADALAKNNIKDDPMALKPQVTFKDTKLTQKLPLPDKLPEPPKPAPAASVAPEPPKPALAPAASVPAPPAKPASSQEMMREAMQYLQALMEAFELSEVIVTARFNNGEFTADVEQTRRAVDTYTIEL